MQTRAEQPHRRTTRIVVKSKVSIFKKPGSPHYYLYVPQDGRRWPKELSTGTTSLAEAKKIATQVEAKLTKKELGIPLGGSFAKFVADYLKFSKLNKALATYVADRGILASLSTFLKSDLSIDKISARTIEDYKRHLRESDYRTASVNKHLRHLKTIFQEAVRWGLLAKNPVKEVRKLRETDTVVRFLTREEITQVLDTILDRAFQALVKFYLLTGVRRNEALFLDWQDLKPDYIQIRNKDTFETKTRKVRKIPISVRLKAVLATLDRSQPRPFPYKPSFVSHKFAKYAKPAGLKDVDVHCLRHTFASHLVMAGVDLVTVKELLGHTSIQTTMIYAHLIPAHVAAAVEKLDYL